MSKNLMIVESPAKAKTIEKYLGKDFTVKSCFGHIRDLPKDDNAIEVENNFKPNYVVPKDKKQLVKELKQLAVKAEDVWLATDEDREGEAISWHLCEVLNLDEDKTKRIVFHEITKPAIKKAVSSPRLINKDVVNAQQARRILDRLVGFKVSPILWRKISRNQGLSAGRVQSVAVRLIVEREREIEGFEVQSFYKVVAYFKLKNEQGKQVLFKGELPKKLSSKEEAEKFLQDCISAEFKISDITVKPAKKSPPPPFTTSTLQQEASRKLSFSVSKTMLVAQKLYEAGKITYMRTDSTNLSDTAMGAAKAEILKEYGQEYSKPRHFKTKSEGAQEAHEAIRPTYFENHKEGGNRDQQRLYELIWKRTLASQMSDAQLERTKATIDISTRKENLVARGEVLKFPGFLALYQVSAIDEESEEKQSDMLPPLAVGQILNLKNMNATQRFTQSPARYNEASLVRKLEDLGIGRPSTYAPTISTIQKREYVVKESREGKERKYTVMTLPGPTEKNAGNIAHKTATEKTGAEKSKLFPTDIGKLVNDFLLEHFDVVFDYGFTADIEKQFDQIADGKVPWENMLKDFYSPFIKKVDDTLENAERVTGERSLGIDKKSGLPVSARLGRYGPMVQIGVHDDEAGTKPKYARIRKPYTIDNITLEQALELFKLPRVVGSFEGKEIKANEGRFGPYVQHDGKFVSIKEGSPMSITEAEAIELIKAKREADAKKHIKSFAEDESIQILNGRWGPYIKAGKKNVKIPKDKVPEDLTFEEVQELIANAPEKKGRGRKK